MHCGMTAVELYKAVKIKKKKKGISTSSMRDESHEPKEYIVCDYIYIKIKNRQN